MYWRVGDMFYGLLSIQIIARVRTRPHLMIPLGQVSGLSLVYYRAYFTYDVSEMRWRVGDISSGLSSTPITARVRTRTAHGDKTLTGWDLSPSILYYIFYI